MSLQDQPLYISGFDTSGVIANSSSLSINAKENCFKITAPKIIWLNVAKYLANNSCRLFTTIKTVYLQI
jgi:hypothetical protein